MAQKTTAQRRAEGLDAARKAVALGGIRSDLDRASDALSAKDGTPGSRGASAVSYALSAALKADDAGLAADPRYTPLEAEAARYAEAGAGMERVAYEAALPDDWAEDG